MPRSDAIKLYAYSHLSILVATILLNSRNIFDFQLGRNTTTTRTMESKKYKSPKTINCNQVP